MKRLGAIFGLLLASSILGAQTAKPAGQHKPTPAPAQNPVSSALAQAEAAIDKQDWPTAERLLNEAVAAGEHSARAYSDIGYVLHATGRAPEAIEAYRKAVDAAPNVFETVLSLGLLLAGQGQWDDAARFLRKATGLTPASHPDAGRAKAWLALGRVLAAKDPQAAMDAYQKAIVLDPGNADAHLELGDLRARSGDTTGAEQELLKAAELAPKNPDPLAALANLYMSVNRLPEAEACLRKFLALSPESVNGHLQLARVLRAQNKNDGALPELQKVLELHPGDIDALRELAALQADGKQYDAAVASYRALLAAAPRDATLHFELGRVLLHQLNWSAAQEELAKAVNLKPDFGDAYYELAVAANGNKNYAVAVKALDYRAKYLPENAGTFFLRATCFDQLRDFKSASEYYKKFLESSGGRFPDEEWKARHRLIAIDPESREKNRK